MDDMTTRGVSWERLDRLVPAEFDRYWQLTLEFLKIAHAVWPGILAERGAIDPAARRDALIKAEAARLATHRDGPVIAAGSTGSMPATAELIASIANLPHGAVVLPGLDIELDANSWELIGGHSDAARLISAPAVGHPQFAMQALLRRIGIAREQVTMLGEAASHGRQRLASEALRPAAVTDRWIQLAGSDFPRGSKLRSRRYPSSKPQTPGKRRFRSPSRYARPSRPRASLRPWSRPTGRWRAACSRHWSAGRSRSTIPAEMRSWDTPAGVFARLAVETALTGVPPVRPPRLAQAPAGQARGREGARARAIAALEKAVLRGPRPQPGTDGLLRALTILRAELAKLRERRTHRSALVRSARRAHCRRPRRGR